MKRLVGMALVAGLAVSAVACSDTSGVNDRAPVTVSLQLDGSALASAGFDGTALLSMGSIPPDSITSLELQVTGLSFLICDAECQNSKSDPETEGEGEGEGDPDECCGYWEPLPLEEAFVIDLKALPTDEQNPLVIAEGSLEIGEYQRIRITLGEENHIWFSEGTSYSKGNSEPFTADGSPYRVTVPSGKITVGGGIVVTDQDAENQENEKKEIVLLFDSGLTYQNLHITGSGKVILTPQFRVR